MEERKKKKVEKIEKNEKNEERKKTDRLKQIERKKERKKDLQKVLVNSYQIIFIFLHESLNRVGVSSAK